ncbi:hypothetical protein [Blastococcus sp. LR1]|uniref:hypothetical protein n=1 Tax=Blastococcus sp. LR1 TaxID=2877000 RepID=UPI001CCB36CF|nr:hypothetical protein [Blastococcus sp. LR1]MCA0143726.1 hypothetical protein [Blastococcus sp. LR1]
MTVIPLPRHGQWVGDHRGQGRSLRVSTHVDVGVLNVSLWREDVCVGTAQLLPAEAAALIGGLSDGLAEIAVQPAPPARHAEPHVLEARLARLEARLASSVRPAVADRFRAALRSARVVWDDLR